MFRRTTIQTLTPHLLALTGYLLLSIALTWPLILHWNTGVYGGVPGGFVYSGFDDASQNVWNMWWVRRALEHRQNPFWTDLLYYPDGVQMYVQTLNIADALITLPVQYLAGPVAAYNTALLVAFVLTAYGGFLLVRAFVPGRAIPLLCGALLTACPFHMVKLQVNHLNLISMQWVIFYILALFQLNQQQKKYSILWTSLFFLLASLTSLYWFLVCAVYSVFWLLVSLGHIYTHRQILYRYLLSGCITCICFAPFLLGIFQIREQLSSSPAGKDALWYTQTIGYSAHMFGLFFPAALHPIWGAQARDFAAATLPGYAPDGWYVAAGWILVLCASFGVWWHWRSHWQIFIAGIAMWLFSLGPVLNIQGKETPIALPYALIHNLPLLGNARRPALFAVWSNSGKTTTALPAGQSGGDDGHTLLR